jgi:hypothetical protein
MLKFVGWTAFPTHNHTLHLRGPVLSFRPARFNRHCSPLTSTESHVTLEFARSQYLWPAYPLHSLLLQSPCSAELPSWQRRSRRRVPAPLSLQVNGYHPHTRRHITPTLPQRDPTPPVWVRHQGGARHGRGIADLLMHGLHMYLPSCGLPVPHPLTTCVLLTPKVWAGVLPQPGGGCRQLLQASLRIRPAGGQ